MQKQITFFLCLLSITFIFSSCHTETKVKTGLLDEVMEASGGLSKWNNKESLAFKKAFTFYDEKGNIEIDRKEDHLYVYGEEDSRKIFWKQDSLDYHLVKNNEGISQYKNGELDESITTEKLYSKLNAADFVINLPYSLVDENASVTSVGKEKFSGKDCNAYKVAFKESEDIWYFYFSEIDFEWVGYWVKTTDHYSLIINDEMTNVNGFSLPSKRSSYRSDSLKSVKYLKAIYLYSDYRIE